jgi:hypothetical protein
MVKRLNFKNQAKLRIQNENPHSFSQKNTPEARIQLKKDSCKQQDEYFFLL